ncbi:MAG: hypothetical protein D6800_08490, partial [Candidatus Zixiibacteriota bacterium]
MKRVGLVFLSLIALTGQILGQTASNELTLDDCIELALKNRSSIIAAMGNEQAAAAGKLSALGAFLPRISASYSYSKGKDFNINPPNRRFIDSNTVELVDEQDQGPNKRLFLDARMTAFDLGNFFDYFAAKADQASAKLNVLASEQDMILAVKTSYYA